MVQHNINEVPVVRNSIYIEVVQDLKTVPNKNEGDSLKVNKLV